jgi:hypothetical protein
MTKYNNGDRCPNCKTGTLELQKADDPNSEYPTRGKDEDYLWCIICDSEFELKEKEI